MQKKIRQILAAVLVLALVAGIVPTLDLSVKASAAEAADKTAVYDYVSDISKYRKTTEQHTANNRSGEKFTVYSDYPAKDGYVFAGWYVNKTTPLSTDKTVGGAYAKFVPEELMKAVAQVSTATDYTTASSALRFVSAVDGTDYLRVGFLLKKEGSTKVYTHAATTVYTSLSAAIENGSLTAGYFHNAASHMYALTVTGIKDQASNYTATPYWITYDGTKVDHIESSKKAVEMGIAANIQAGNTTIADGYDYSWYTPSATEYTISTLEQMRAFTAISNNFNFAGKTVKLGADIAYNPGTAGDKMISSGSGNPYLAGVEALDPIGSNDVPFAGTFDGQGHTVSGLAAKTGYDGLFAAVKNATVKNLRVTRSTLRGGSGGGMSAGLIATAYGTNTVENVYIGADVNLWGATYQGGIVAHNQGNLTVSNCWSKAYVNPQWASAIHSGGIVGTTANTAGLTVNLTNCLYDGTMNGTAQGSSFIGGLIGSSGNAPTTTITDCLVSGTVGIVTSTGTLYKGSLIGSKSWTAARTVMTDVYATVEACQNADGAAQTIRADQSFASGVTAVAAANLKGTAAITNASGLDFYSAWAAMNSSTPVLATQTVNSTAIDFSWYDANATEYVLYDAADLNGFAYLSATDTFSGKTVKLGADITYNTGNAADWAAKAPANVWTPAGNGGNGFVGTFDGQGHTISGLYVKNTGYATFIGRMYGATAKLMDVRIVNSYFESDGTGDSFHNGAGIVGRATNGYTISGVYTDAYFKGVKGVGIVAFCDAGVSNFSNCWFDGTINVAGAKNVGGMVGSVPNNQVTNITDCLFTGTMTGTANSGVYIGGLVGIGPYNATVKATRCLVAGDMSGVTGGTTGSVIGNNPGGNKSVYTNVYATGETHANLKGAGGATFPVTSVAKTAITGVAAKTALSGFDFITVWGTRDNDVPQLGNDELDISWYDANATEYVLYDAADLYGFSYLQESNEFNGKTIKLGADIVLNEGNAADWATTAPANVWEPIGKDDASKSFEGTFDGQGHTISGLYYDSALYGGSLFVYTGVNAVIKNLKLTNSYIKSTHGAEWSATGAIAAFVNGTTFQDIYCDAIIDTNSGYTGGIGGRVQGNGVEVENCQFAGTITATGTAANYIGGIFGGYNTNTAGASTIKNTVMSGTVIGSNNLVGGLAGRAAGASGANVTVDGFEMTGTVTGANTFIGGIFGLTEKVPVTITNSAVSGNVTGTAGIAGGFVGRVADSNTTIEDSVSTATVNGGTKLGGFVGQTYTAGFTTTVKNSTFNGTVTGTNTSETMAAGFVGHVNNGNVYVQNCTGQGTLVAPGPYAAGVIAQIVNVAGANVLVEKTIITTDNQCASSNAGGIIGRIMGANPTVALKDNLAKATFTTDSWCTAQIIAHAQGDNVEMSNNFFVQTTNSYKDGIESSGGNVTNAAQSVSATLFDYLVELHQVGIMPDYDGFEDSGFVIMDVADLYGFNIYNELKGMSGKTVKLGADITINEGNAADWELNAPKYNWKPVGNLTTAGSFKGNFDGQGHTISGLYCAHPNGNSMGLFREVSGTITNFKLVNSYLVNTADSNYGYNGVIASYQNGGTISKIYTDAIIHSMDSYSGGIVGFTGGTNATVTDCQFDGKFIARCTEDGSCAISSGQGRGHANYIGGIVGAGTATNTNISNCYFTGSIFNECGGAHRTAGIIGGLPNTGKAATVTGCVSVGKMGTLRGNNSYHFSMIMDGRAAGGVTTNSATLFDQNYVLTTPAYSADGVTTINGGANISGEQGGKQSTVRHTADEMVTDIQNRLANDTSKLDMVNAWNYNPGALPTLKWLGGETPSLNTHYLTTEEGGKLLSVTLPTGTFDTFTDMNIQETETGSTYKGEVDGQSVDLPYYYLEQINEAPVEFKDIFYGYGTYLTKYTGTTLANAQSLIESMKAFGFQEFSSSNLNGDCYYTALTFGANVYAVTHFVHTGETYISVSNEQKLSPFMNSEYYKTAVNTAGGEPSSTHSDVTITSVSLVNSGDAFIIRLKNGHYIVIDGGTNNQTDRDAIAAALGASAEAYSAGTKNQPQVVVDAWFFTHAHADHVGIFRGGIYGPIQVDVYIKGFYYNFTEKWHTDSTISVGSETYDGYVNLAYAYADQDADGTNYYKKGVGDTSEWWVERTAVGKTASNVNTPAWGSTGIPIYRVQAGQKFYFDGMTVEVPYTQEQVQPHEMQLDLNGTCSWFLLTDDYGHTFLDAGDAERWNADAVVNLYSSEYKIYGTDVGKTFHHGLNPLVKHTGTFGETPGQSTAGNYDYSLLDKFYGINTAYGDGKQTQFAFITKTAGSWLQISGYNNKGGSQRDLSIHEMYYLFGYILTNSWGGKIRDYKSWGYKSVATKIPFAAYGGDFSSGSYTDTFEGTTTVTMNASGVTWNKSHTTGIYK